MRSHCSQSDARHGVKTLGLGLTFHDLCLSVYLLVALLIAFISVNPASANSGRDPLQSIKPEQLRQAIVAHVQREYSHGKVEVTAQVLSPRKGVTVSARSVKIHVEQDHLRGRTGRRAFRVSLLTGSHPSPSFNVVAHVTVQADIVSPRRAIKANDVLRAGDLTYLKKSLLSAQNDFLFDVDHAIGKRSKRPLQPGQLLRGSFLEAIPIIEKGDRVVIEARIRGLLVQAVGIAKASGHAGETIPVINKDSGRDIAGVVKGPGLVEVTF